MGAIVKKAINIPGGPINIAEAVSNPQGVADQISGDYNNFIKAYNLATYGEENPSQLGTYSMPTPDYGKLYADYLSNPQGSTLFSPNTMVTLASTGEEFLPYDVFKRYYSSVPSTGITTAPQVQEQAQVVEDADKTLAETLFPQGEFLDIRETATSPTEYNIEATKDLVENLPGIVQPFAPAAAGIMSLPYDAIQAYQRMQPGSGISGFMKAYQAERPLQSAYERFVGASGPLAENINQAVSTLNPFQQQQYMQYATQNPEQARAAAQRSQEFVRARGGN